jgi:hypothetical protein
MLSIEHDIFIALVAAGFGNYDDRPANAVQNFKRLVTCSA